MKYKINKCEAIVWRDAFNPAECKWMNEKDIDDFLNDFDFIVCNVGWVIHENKEMITIVGMASKQEAVGHIQRIPKGCVIKRTPLEFSF